jgi:biotin carboxylase
MVTKNILLIDPFGSHTSYCEEIKQMGYKPFALLTNPLSEIPEAFLGDFHSTKFEELIFFDSMEKTIPLLKKYNFDAVIPCDQLSLRFSDKIASFLNLKCNPVESYKCRVNKSLMRERISEKSIDDFKYIMTSKLEYLFEWISRTGFPVILKPSEAAGGSISVKKCHNSDEVINAFIEISQMKEYFYRNLDGKVLAEEYLEGTEYIVNISHNESQKKLIAISGVDKIELNGNASIYKNIFNVDIKTDESKQVFEYCQKINNALDVKIGINDTEVKMTPKGIRLIEVNNRMPGARIPYVINKCSGFNCFQNNVRLFLGESLPDNNINYTKHYNLCFLINYEEGRVKDFTGLKIVENLQSYDSHYIYSKTGEIFPVTSDLDNNWGIVILLNENRNQLKSDAETVHREMELLIE